MTKVFPQKVATMYRIESRGFSEPYLFIRKNTIVKFGESNRRHGAVLMSNPGCYTPRYADGDWQGFRRGEELRGWGSWGFPDSTMQNVIRVLKVAADQTHNPLETFAYERPRITKEDL